MGLYFAVSSDAMQRNADYVKRLKEKHGAIFFFFKRTACYIIIDKYKQCYFSLFSFMEIYECLKCER